MTENQRELFMIIYMISLMIVIIDVAILDGITLASSTTIKDLGFNFDQDMSFNSHKAKQNSRTVFLIYIITITFKHISI